MMSTASAGSAARLISSIVCRVPVLTGLTESVKCPGIKLFSRRRCSVLHILRWTPAPPRRSEEHTSELQSLMRISYAVFCLKKKKLNQKKKKYLINATHRNKSNQTTQKLNNLKERN